MRFASAKQIVIFSIVTCAALFGLDYWKNPQLWHPAQEQHEMAMAESGAHLTLWMNHLCCDSCLDEVRQALATVPGLDASSATGPKNLLTAAEAAKMPQSSDYSGPVEVKVTDLTKVDFAALDRALRADGLVAGRIELGGVPHFRFQAVFPRLCCGGEKATQEGIEFLKASTHGGFTWLDSLNVERDKNTVVAYARYLEPGKTVDVAELLSGLNSIGYAPASLHVMVGEDTKLAQQK